ncbi:helix-turn-helix domain-containing protein [Rhodopila sp.]|uniref:helix-turn-helix domain-containing protein n=1 Tax=Rhodopila sp. TaxID=2480087 RepID=UPI003D0B69AB
MNDEWNRMRTSGSLAAQDSFGNVLRDWRRRRRMSQLDLSCDADVGKKHLSLLESGRSRPARSMVLHLAECLDVPLRVRNTMLVAAGYAPAYQQRNFLVPDMAVARRNVELVLAGHDPFPAMAVDRHWMMISANKAVANLVTGAEPMLLRPPVNLLRLCLHPAGLACRIVNLVEWRAHITARLRREIDTTGDAGLVDLLEEIRDYPSPPGGQPARAAAAPHTVAMPFQLVTIDGTLSFFNTTTRFSTPMDITLSELAIEAFLPADPHTAAVLRRDAQRCQAPETYVPASANHWVAATA